MSVTFECEPGYAIKGHGALTCLEDGNGWSHEVPACSEFFRDSTSAFHSADYILFQSFVIRGYILNNQKIFIGLDS